MAFWTSKRKKVASILITIAAVIGITRLLIKNIEDSSKNDKNIKKDPIVLAVRDSMYAINTYLQRINNVINDKNATNQDIDNAIRDINKLDILLATKLDIKKLKYLQERYNFDNVEDQTYLSLQKQLPSLKELLVKKRVKINKDG